MSRKSKTNNSSRYDFYLAMRGIFIIGGRENTAVFFYKRQAKPLYLFINMQIYIVELRVNAYFEEELNKGNA